MSDRPAAPSAPHLAVMPEPDAPGRGSVRERYARLRWEQGREAMRAQRWDEARRWFGLACRAAPGDALYQVNLAVACLRLARLDDAIVAARRATGADVALAVAWLLLGDALRGSHRYAEALDAYEHAEAAGHEDADAYVHHAMMMQALQRPQLAIAKLLKATMIRPHHAAAHGMLAAAFRDLGLMAEAVECLKTLQALVPGHLQGRVVESYEKRHLFDWRDLASDVQALSDMLESSRGDEPRPTTSFALLSLPIEPRLQTRAAAMDACSQAVGVVPLPPVSPAGRPARGPLHVGWVSSDFRDHPVAQLLVEVFERWPRGAVRHTLYSHAVDDGSSIRARLVAAVDAVVDVNDMSDRAAADRIRADGVDVLIDLQGHTRGQRLAIAAHRPAPVQATYLGFPGSTGADYIDYLIGDPYVTPLELAHLYTEKLAQLPTCFQPNGRWRALPRPMSRAEAGLPDDAFVMCAFNHTYKILPEAFDVWCEVMREVPRAVLWLKETNGQLHANVRAAAAGRGVDPARVLFAGRVDYADHFSRLALADVFVDTWPYNAHTTAGDALWAGVPVVTVYGNGFASRVAASVLNAAGLPELAFADAESYGLAIRALATDEALLTAMRQHLDGTRMTMPLFDAGTRARELDALLRRMHARWAAGLPPEHLPAAWPQQTPLVTAADAAVASPRETVVAPV